MRAWLVHGGELTPDQIRATRLSPDQHRVILGGPGSGKTQVLLHRAGYLCDRYQIPASRFRIFAFTRVLKSYISSALDLLDLEEECVTTVASWCYTYHKSHIGRRVPLARNGGPDFDRIRQEVLEEIKGLPSPIFDFVLVDEGQDLDSDTYELLKLLSRHITVCVDDRQQIYAHGSKTESILACLGVERPSVSLLETFRCCPYITRLTAELLDDPREREFHRMRSQTVQSERELPLLYVASSFEEERERLHDVLRQRLSRGERVGILVPQRRQAYGFATGLQEAGFEVQAPLRREELDFSRSTPKIMPYHSAKGLMFDTVLMPRLVSRSFRPHTTGSVNRLLFVGLARAVDWAYLSTVQGQELTIIDRLKHLQKDGIIAVQQGSARAPDPTTTEEDNDEPPFAWLR